MTLRDTTPQQMRAVATSLTESAKNLTEAADTLDRVACPSVLVHWTTLFTVYVPKLHSSCVKVLNESRPQAVAHKIGMPTAQQYEKNRVAKRKTNKTAISRRKK